MQVAVLLAAASLPLVAGSTLPPGVHFSRGAVNSVVLDGFVAVYSQAQSAGHPLPLLITESRRTAFRRPVAMGVFHAPQQAIPLLTAPQAFWEHLETARFHDYSQVSTKVPVEALAISAMASDLKSLSRNSRFRLEEISTPGYSPDAASYVIETGGKRLICTGDLIYGDGQLLDLYSMQDAVPEAKARGYHGYAARAADEIASLRQISSLKPDLLLPAHGPMVTNPQRSISLLIERLQAFLQSHYETDALRWYWGDKNLRIRSKAVEKPLDVMPMAEQATLPPDILAIGNSRVILSKTGAAFLVDAGYAKTLPELRRMRASGAINSVEGIWITHYHDDHTDYVNDIVKEFHSKVYFTSVMTEVLSAPGAFRLPCLTNRPIPIQDAKRDGETMRWHEWQFTFWNFPGQTLYHGGLVAKRDDGQTYLFTGDSFTPSGMDDYCMQNRDFLRPRTGYEYCLRKMSTLPHDTWLLNQHVEPMFRFNKEQTGRMQAELEKRSAILRELSPWPDINYMLDESWARIYPYALDSASDQVFSVSLRILNHAPQPMVYRVNWNTPPGLKFVSGQQDVAIPAHEEGHATANYRALAPGLHVLTAGVSFGEWNLPEWTEALIRVH